MVDNVDCRRPLPPYLVTFRPAPDVTSLPADVPPRRQPAMPPPDIRAGGRFQSRLQQRRVPWYRWHISPSRSQSEGTRSVLLLERQLNVEPSALKEFVPDGMYGLECSKTLLS